LEPSGKKGIFVGYCEVSKAFRIYIPGHHHTEINMDVTFDEEATLKKSRRCQLEEMYEEEPVNPRTTESVREVPVAVLIHTCKRELEFGSLSVSLEAQCLGSQPTLSL
jgi:hypothetical protein